MIKKLTIIIMITYAYIGYAQKFSDYYYEKLEVFESAPDTKNEIIFLGNSITEGGDWTSLFPDKNVINRGISGDITKGVLNRLEEVTSSKPDKIFLLIGTNDLAHGRSVQHVIKYYRLIIETILEDSKKTQLYLQSILPYNPNVGDQFQGHKSKQKEVLIVNDILQKMAKDYKISYIDIHSNFKDEKGELNSKFTEDGLHLNQMGYLQFKKSISIYVYEK